MIIKYTSNYFDKLFSLLSDVYNTNISQECLEANYLSDTKFILLSINENDDVAGCAFVEFMTDYVRYSKSAFITYVAVNENYRRLGIGKSLFEYIEQMCLSFDIHTIELTSANYRIAAHAFYDAIGFTKKATAVFIKELNV